MAFSPRDTANASLAVSTEVTGVCGLIVLLENISALCSSSPSSPIISNAESKENELSCEKADVFARLVSVPSEGLFRDQPQSYQESVLPAGIARYGMTSGLPVTLQGLVGEKGFIHGHDMFGFSAPYTVLDKEVGYNGETVAAEVKKLLGRA